MKSILRHIVRSFTLIEYVLRHFAEITAQTDLWGKLGRLLPVAGLGFFLFGLVMDLGGALGWAALFSALKLPLLFLASGKKVILIGINFSTEQRNVDSWQVVE
jgi:hypothetical protein